MEPLIADHPHIETSPVWKPWKTSLFVCLLVNPFLHQSKQAKGRKECVSNWTVWNDLQIFNDSLFFRQEMHERTVNLQVTMKEMKGHSIWLRPEWRASVRLTVLSCLWSGSHCRWPFVFFDVSFFVCVCKMLAVNFISDCFLLLLVNILCKWSWGRHRKIMTTSLRPLLSNFNLWLMAFC